MKYGGINGIFLPFKKPSKTDQYVLLVHMVSSSINQLITGISLAFEILKPLQKPIVNLLLFYKFCALLFFNCVVNPWGLFIIANCFFMKVEIT